MWYEELLAPDEVTFEAGVFLLSKPVASALKHAPSPPTPPKPGPTPPEKGPTPPEPGPGAGPQPPGPGASVELRVIGTLPPESWNRMGTKILPKLRSGSDLNVTVGFKVSVKSAAAAGFAAEIRQILEEIGLGGSIRVETDRGTE